MKGHRGRKLDQESSSADDIAPPSFFRSPKEAPSTPHVLEVTYTCLRAIRGRAARGPNDACTSQYTQPGMTHRPAAIITQS